MVYCSKCGTLNPDGTVHCSNCGAQLNYANNASQPYDWREHHHRHYEERYGYYHSADRGFGLLIGGLFIILIAIGLLYGFLLQYIWPFVLVIIGVWLIALFFMRNRRYRQPPPP